MLIVKYTNGYKYYWAKSKASSVITEIESNIHYDVNVVKCDRRIICSVAEAIRDGKMQEISLVAKDAGDVVFKKYQLDLLDSKTRNTIVRASGHVASLELEDCECIVCQEIKRLRHKPKSKFIKALMEELTNQFEFPY